MHCMYNSIVRSYHLASIVIKTLFPIDIAKYSAKSTGINIHTSSISADDISENAGEKLQITTFALEASRVCTHTHT